MSILAALAATAVVGFLLGRLSAQPTIRTLNGQFTELRDWSVTLEALLRAAEYAAGHDRLTGLPNRTSAARKFTIRAVLGEPTIVALIDLDRFKQINDSHGHHAGDDLLRAAAERLSLAAKLRGGIAARLGGDEFAILLRGGLEPGTSVAAILNSLAQPVPLHTHSGDVTVHPTASAGVAVFDGTYGTFDTILGHADIALYNAKQQRGSYRIYTPDMRMPQNAGRHGPRRRDQHLAGRDLPDAGEVTE
ncbi:diguanylate cyclase domain-containing protein [Actinoplanes sp. NPDC051513]|uniref:diguanylate cyclase domain-containing protein n=1 Tax=Actinoplanes sp. NPDC051513 TaxID=3363908 RepID=UPI0037B1FFFB